MTKGFNIADEPFENRTMEIIESEDFQFCPERDADNNCNASEGTPRCWFVSLCPLGFNRRLPHAEALSVPLCDCCGEEADYSDYGISLCHSCKQDDCEGLGTRMDMFARHDREDF